MQMSSLKERIAMTDSTFALVGDTWSGKCLICNGHLSFDRRSGFGANVEHIVPRTEGGTNDLHNLGLTHPRCNAEKGRNWDNRKKRPRDPNRYRTLIDRSLRRRQGRWRDAYHPPTAGPSEQRR